MERTMPMPALARPVRNREEIHLRRELRRGLLISNLYEFVIAVFCILAVPVILLSPGGVEQSAVGHMTASLAPCWLVLFGAGGVMIVAGMLKLSPRLEILGLFFFVAAMVTDGAAVLVYSGGSGAAGALTFLAVAVAGACRARTVWRVVMAVAHRTGEYER